MSEIVDRLRELAAEDKPDPEYIRVHQDEARDLLDLIDQLSHHEAG